MKKTANILSIISLVFAGLSLLIFVGAISVFWKPICMYYFAPDEVIAHGPVIPIDGAISVIGCCVLAIIICICVKQSRSIAGEILSASFLIVVLPVVAWYLSTQQAYEIGRLGATAMAAFAFTKNISTYAYGLMDVATALCLVVCGMSISRKVCTRKANYLD